MGTTSAHFKSSGKEPVSRQLLNQVKGEQHLMDLNKTVNFICEKFDEYERDTAEKEKIINGLQKNVNDMSATIESLKGCLDRQEQYSRRNSL